MMRRTKLGVALGTIALLLLSIVVPLAHGGSSSAQPSGAVTFSSHPAAGGTPNPFSTGMAASLALGAPNLSAAWPGHPVNGSSFVPEPELSCMDPNGNLWVPDFGGSRVMEFTAPFAFKQAASVIIGQTSATGYLGNTTRSGLSGPGACTFDSHGDLWVSDFFNDRVLEYVPPFSTGMIASVVLGQSTFTGSATGTTAVNESRPIGLTFDAKGDLWVADALNNRVLEYVPPFSTGMAASFVLGQTSFTAASANSTATTMDYPISVEYSPSGILWVADFLNSRVLGFSAPFTTGEGASYVLGQSTFIGSLGSVSAHNLSGPASVSVDSHGDLWVSDNGNNRVVEYFPPFSSGENASVAIGQTSLTTNTFGTSPTTLYEPLGAFVAPNGALWVSDSANNRLLEYVPAVYKLSFVASGASISFHWSVNVSGKLLAGTGTTINTTVENGSYAWSIPAISGYSIAPKNGTAVVNGANLAVPVTIAQLTYTVTFTPLGLPSSSNWSVTLAGVTHKSVSNGSIAFTEPDGTYGYLVLNVSGFVITPTHGSVIVNGGNQSVFVGFSAPPSSSSSSSSSSASTFELILFLVVGLVVGLVIGMVVMRRRKGGTASPAAPWTPPPPSPGTPPPAAGTPPPPPPGAGGPPPGATG